MRKFRMLAVLLVFALVLSGCCLKHEWVEADCENPKHCAKCDEVEGTKLGHEWMDATCETPRTCERCGETKGEALGHEWMDATCETPRTCERCGETEGEALGHTYSGWELFDKDNMVRNCTVCNAQDLQPVDRELIGMQFLVDEWECTAILDYDDGNWEFFDEPLFFVEFHEDMTVTLTLFFDPVEGTLSFDEYDAEDDEYVFTAYVDGGEYGFDYVVENDNLFTFGSGVALAWERVGGEH